MTRERCRLGTALLIAGHLLAAAASAQQSDPLDEMPEVENPTVKRLRELADPGNGTEPDKAALKPPFEFYRTQVAPFDVLTYVKPGHWAWITQEMQANQGDYEGYLRTAPVGLYDMPKAVVFQRGVRLLDEEQMRLSWPVFLPRETRMLDIELVRPDALRPDGGTQAPFLTMSPQQMLVVILSDDPLPYDVWKRYQAVVPATTDTTAQQAVDRRSYYRLVVSQEPDEPNLPINPLTWTTISHVVWDGFDPNNLTVGEQSAMIDWLHWGGQLIIAGGATQTLSLLADDESFLAGLLPGVPSGDDRTLGDAELQGLARAYPPPAWKLEIEDQMLGAATMNFSIGSQFTSGAAPRDLSRYKPPEPIKVPRGRSLFLAGLDPVVDDAEWISDADGQRFAIERRVGRGRITVLAFDPSDAILQNWKGYDTLVRRMILRRPEDRWNPSNLNDNSMLGGLDLSWYRILGRDLAPAIEPVEPLAPPRQSAPSMYRAEVIEDGIPTEPVAAWLDSSGLPSRARDALVDASGIEIPGSRFVLRVILAYMVALVPLNWLVCRFVLRRRELAWALVPLLAFGFAAVVERAAAFDTGYDRACDEIDVLELQPGYLRGHLSRFAVLYSTGRESFSVEYPGNPSALALPLNTGLAIRGEQSTESTWQSTPGPSMLDFRVEPRSLAMYRAEQMVPIDGPILLQGDDQGPLTVTNRLGLDLHDAVLIAAGDDPTDSNRYIPIGSVVAGASVELPNLYESFVEAPNLGHGGENDPIDWVEAGPTFELLCNYRWGRPEDLGALRLVAWTADPFDGQQLEPEVDRHRGVTLVVAHLRYGAPPAPDGAFYTTFNASAE